MKILRSDFHGAMVEVISSRNATYVGLKGIVIQETLRTFKIVTEENQTKIILKSVCIFALAIENNTAFIINGNTLVYRPSDRIKHKFKFKKA